MSKFNCPYGARLLQKIIYPGMVVFEVDEVSKGVGSKMIISFAYAAAILPESTEQSKQEIWMLSWHTPGMICTRSKLDDNITMLHPEAYA